MEDGFEGLGEGRKQALKEALKKEWISSPVYKLPERKVKKQRLLSSDDWNAIAVHHFEMAPRIFKGEGVASNDVGNGDAAEASAESPVKAAKGGGNQGATISPDGDKQRDLFAIGRP